MNEFEFIHSIKQKFYKQPSLMRGIGDDAAVFRQTSQDIVTAIDTFVEDVHFSEETMDPFYIGYRALAANISDLAAMGALPAFYLVSIVIPKKWNKQKIIDIFSGMQALATKHKMDLIGGDTVSGSELSLSITVIGYVEKGKARYRHLARAGDLVFVTGTLGDSQAGLYLLLNNNIYQDKEYFIKKHQAPTPRIEFIKGLEKIARVALNDISDGIANETAEIAEASKVNIILHEEKLPVSPSFKQFPLSLQRKWKLFGGEDFELLGTVSKEDWGIVQHAAKIAEVQVTEVGYVEDGENGHYGLVYLSETNQKQLLGRFGYDHFK